MHNEAAANITKTLGGGRNPGEGSDAAQHRAASSSIGKGLKDLLLKEQQDDQLTVETDMQRKQVTIAELQAEAEARQKVKEARG